MSLVKDLLQVIEPMDGETWLCGGVKSNLLSRSSAKAEFIAMARGICQGMWLKRVLNVLKVP